MSSRVSYFSFFCTREVYRRSADAVWIDMAVCRAHSLLPNKTTTLRWQELNCSPFKTSTIGIFLEMRKRFGTIYFGMPLWLFCTTNTTQKRFSFWYLRRHLATHDPVFSLGSLLIAGELLHLIVQDSEFVFCTSSLLFLLSPLLIDLNRDLYGLSLPLVISFIFSPALKHIDQNRGKK